MGRNAASGDPDASISIKAASFFGVVVDVVFRQPTQGLPHPRRMTDFDVLFR